MFIPLLITHMLLNGTLQETNQYTPSQGMEHEFIWKVVESPSRYHSHVSKHANDNIQNEIIQYFNDESWLTSLCFIIKH